MASSAPPRTVHQDYIARIRYSNALPPPPNPPKLLDIPNTGLASGQYTTPGFASRLARDQPLNIEADAELGMPIDLVGMPGIFDGDESSIQAPTDIPAPHPHDRALLRPLSTLGKPKFSDASISFLRRTEYISSHTSKSRFDSTTSKSLISNTGTRAKKAAQTLDKESPEAIKKDIEESFKVAANSLKNKHLIKHPTKPNLKLVDAYPLLPDNEAWSDAGGFVEIKFFTNPVPPSSTYDIRLDASILKPMESSSQEEAIKQAQQEAYEQDPIRNPLPEPVINYEFFMPQEVSDVKLIKRKFDHLDPERDSDDLYTFKGPSGDRSFRFKKIRAYESPAPGGGQEGKYDTVVLALHDGKDGEHVKGAHYYPIVQKIVVKPQRNKHIEMKRLRLDIGEAEAERVTDFIDLKIRDPGELEIAVREDFKTWPFGKPEEVGEEGPNGSIEVGGEEDAEGDEE